MLTRNPMLIKNEIFLPKWSEMMLNAMAPTSKPAIYTAWVIALGCHRSQRRCHCLLTPPSRAPRVSPAPKTPFPKTPSPFPFKGLPRRLGGPPGVIHWKIVSARLKNQRFIETQRKHFSRAFKIVIVCLMLSLLHIQELLAYWPA